MKIFSVLMALGMAMGFCSCATVPSRPVWVDGKTSEIAPSVAYLVGIGSGEKREEAMDKARAEIAKQFSVQVTERRELAESFSSKEGKEVSTWLDTQRFDQLLQTYTSQSLEGIEIRETWLDEAAKHYYALALLPRDRSIIRLEERVSTLDMDIKKLVDASHSETDKLQKIRPLVKAYGMLPERDIKNRQLAVLKPTGRGITPEVETATVDRELTEVLKTLRIAVSIQGDGNAAVRNAIVASLGAGRLLITENPEEADILIKGHVDSRESDKGNKTGFEYAKARSTLELINQLDGSTFGLIEKELRDGANSLEEAKAHALSRLTQEILSEFNTLFRGYLAR